IFHPLNSNTSELIYENEELEVHTIILNHRIPCTGFLFAEKEKPRKLIKEELQRYNIPVSAYADLKNGKDYTNESGKVVPNSELTTNPRSHRIYEFCYN